MIFLSHNVADKPFVEPIATALADAFGQDKVFYDAWSIQPGDSIIEQMNKGLGEASHFFLFVTEHALASKMVSLEWYNALALATKGKLRIVPVRSSDCDMPVLLTDRLYIDLYTVGLEAATRQIVDVIKDVGPTAKAPETFSNLEAILTVNKSDVSVVVRARHFMEPTASIAILFAGASAPVTLDAPRESQYISGGVIHTTLTDGRPASGKHIGLIRAITPKNPMIFTMTPDAGAKLEIVGVFHIEGDETQTPIPFKIVHGAPSATFVPFATSALNSYSVAPGTYSKPV